MFLSIFTEFFRPNFRISQISAKGKDTLDYAKSGIDASLKNNSIKLEEFIIAVAQQLQKILFIWNF